MTRILRYVCPILSVGLLGSGYFLGGLRWPAVGLIVFGIIWVSGLLFHWDWIHPLGLFAASGVAAFGLFMDPSPVFLISGALLGLLAWDLSEFHNRLRMASPEDDTASLEKRHLLRLFAIALVGGCLCTFALIIHLNPSFEWMVILVFFTVWGIGRMVDWLLKNSC